MSDVVTASGPWFAVAVTMVHTLWVGAVVGAAAVASRVALRRAGASVRYAVAVAWLGVLAMVPVGVGVWVARGTVKEESPRSVGAAEVREKEESGAADLRSALRGVPLRSVPAWREVEGEVRVRGEGRREVVGGQRGQGAVAGWLGKWRGVAAVLPAVWVFGAAGMLGWSLMGLVGAERLRRGARPADAEVDGLVVRLARRMRARAVAVMLCERVGSPVLVGIVRPVILLPAALVAELSPGQLEMILVHELAHVRRWDNLVNLLQRVVESALFFQPAVWVVSAWVRQEREHCCDDAVVAAAGAEAREEYAGVLVSISQWRAGWAVAGSAAGGGDLVSRIGRIVTRRDSMRVSRACVAALVVPVVLSGVWFAWGAGPAAGGGKVITVAKEGGEYTSIQAAIDAAPEGAVVKIAPGAWDESITVKKGVTLAGAGWDKTTLTAAVPAEAKEAVKELNRQMEKGMTMGEWKARVDALSQKYALPAVIRVEGAQGVEIRGLKVAGVAGPNQSGRSADVALVVFDGAGGRIENCAVVGSPGLGIQIFGRSDVRVEHCLVAGVWGTGIGIGPMKGASPKVVVADCDVRNCYYAGIALSGQGVDVAVEGCRIWGTAWHGIRYDDASPTVKGNRIYNVARCGIYASGDTHATVTGNLFLNNEMDGVSCWFANKDVITGNTFASNQREGLAVLGGSRPTVERNLFVGQPVAIVTLAIAGRRGEEKGTDVGDPKLDGNWFWKNVAEMKKPGDKEPVKVDLSPETRSRVEEVQFADAAKGDFSLPAGSPAREAKVGVAEPLTEASPYPLQGEEKAIMPEGGSWDYQKWKKG